MILDSNSRTSDGGTIMKRLSVTISLLVMLLLLWNISTVTAQFSEAGVEQFKVAVNAPDFTLRKLDGGNLSLKDFKGKVVILNFFATY